MTNDGRGVDKPTSYGLQPPAQRSYEPTRAARAPGHGEGVAESGAGRLIGGRYRLESRLGHGGMGTVWKAHDVVVDRDVAVKEPRVPDHLAEWERQTVYQRMQREARAAAKIDHPSVVTVHDVVVEEGRPWIVMELVRGSSLADQLAEGTMDPGEAARIGLDILGALSAAHEEGVLHRDVKPGNVLLGRHGRVVLTDFGIAQIEGEQALTEAGAFIGSPEFIAPERVLGQRPGPESDLWSLGVVLYAAVEGMSPYRRSTTPATLQAVLSAEPAPPARGSGEFGILLTQLLRKNPSARPTAAEIRHTLQSVARPPRSTPESTGLFPAGAHGGPGGGRQTRRISRKAQLGLGSGVLAVVLALVLLLANPFASEDPPAHWVVREEGEVVKASLALPRDYQRNVDGANDGYIVFNDPSGIFTVHLERVAGGKDTGTAAEEAKWWEDYYEAGAEKTMQKARASTRKASQQGRPAAQITTVYQWYGASATDLSHRRRDHLYVNDRNVYWRLEVTMPAKGKAAEDGERLFQDVVKHLNIQEL
ncbi:serine/threonine protein kinase [Streptomyces sp. A3M-1-3]|uniref:serine/threonine-protein kinase n=1 Tax=Streptomyces sp. A3M-1-3 TaxID=2962044 RepID=UPI0020B81142|nr:serine/threonine-protein kinase [Streptomyces sp. A3M-1-3]MCP3821609.1 serine/threonine protein kinase [Streptomyces sp. A3M-1-3]